MPKILVGDDEVGIRELLFEILRDEGHDVQLAENAAGARAAREAGRPDMVLLDIWMPDTDGITLLKEWSGNGQLNMPVVMMSGHATIDTAVEATRIGAMDFLEKPIGMQKLLAAVKKALERSARHAGGGLSLGAFARPGPLRDLKRRLDQVLAKSPLLLLRSAPGGIVELVARSAQVAGKPWIDLAHETNPLSTEMLQRAAGGVLWCEELARLTRLQQKNLLFAAERLDRYSLRLVAATTHSSAELLALGWDEAGLAHLFETGLGVPGLAELKDEVPDIAAHLLTQLMESDEIPLRRFSSGALNALRQHVWSGGYAELKSAVKSLALASLGEEIGEDEARQLLAPAGESGPAPVGLAPEVIELPLREAREAFERMYFEYHLATDGGNMTRLAEKTGLERTHLYRKLKDLGLR
ncbi:MAG: sigma-54-dependent Fis family transcriptional regulator [Betaproteobacteria bacterium]|nr:sigma-54-dependent Fis family transcriptional regulator [Betaproteobacteria bacterium]